MHASDLVETKRHRSWLLFLRVELVLTVVVILGGAVVRATGSGAGCGEHWPLCNGEVIPVAKSLSTAIEFTHRVSSGLSLLLFFVLFRWGQRIFPLGHPTRTWARIAGISFILEAGIGAFLVLRKLVEMDASLLRGIVIALHLINTNVLLAGLIGMLWNATRPSQVTPRSLGRSAYFNLFGWCVTAAMGAIVALGDTLFPASSLSHGLTQDLAHSSHLFVRFRLAHPVVAIGVSIWTLLKTIPTPGQPLHAYILLRSLVLAQLGCGVLNWILLAPVALQLTHLTLSAGIWMSLLWFYFSNRRLAA